MKSFLIQEKNTGNDSHDQKLPVLICGIDEAGRGPLAGPVYAASVILSKDFPYKILNDSKKLSAADREKARSFILEKALAWGIGAASHTEIDSINILQASLLAMKRAFEDMLKRASDDLLGEKITIIVDGKFIPDISTGDINPEDLKKRAGPLQTSDYLSVVSCTALIKADAKVEEVMAASILAKTERDSFMKEMSLLYPQYCYEKHKGYPTQAHREAVLKYGPSPIQRMTFKVK